RRVLFGSGQSAGPLLIHELEAVASRKAAHLLKPLNRHQGGERFTLALDDKFVVSERDAIQHVANSRPDVHRRHFVSHSTTPASIIVAIVNRSKWGAQIAGNERQVPDDEDKTDQWSWVRRSDWRGVCRPCWLRGPATVDAYRGLHRGGMTCTSLRECHSIYAALS